jgi:hypothetical protein
MNTRRGSGESGRISLCFRLKDRLAHENIYLEEEIRGAHHFGEVVGESRALKRILSRVATVAATDAAVLLLGETGTGKELIARAVHSAGERRVRSLVTVNCATSPAGLLESEWFGHERGAFTGALAQKIGRFELAHQGMAPERPKILLESVPQLPAKTAASTEPFASSPPFTSDGIESRQTQDAPRTPQNGGSPTLWNSALHHTKNLAGARTRRRRPAAINADRWRDPLQVVSPHPKALIPKRFPACADQCFEDRLIGERERLRHRYC